MAVFHSCNDRQNEYYQLAFIVDQSAICFDHKTGKFGLFTAEGASNWNGEFDEEWCDSLDELEKVLIYGERTYNPSLSGAKELMIQAKAAWELPCWSGEAGGDGD